MSAVASKSLIIGSRGSQLALWQARHVASGLQALGVESRITVIKTTGDHLQTASLVQAGGKGLFTKEIEEALLSGEIDLAVHSLKDLPTENPAGLTIAAIPEREDPRDAIVGARFRALARGARVGTSSGRRGAQLKIRRPDLDIQPIRGNVDTRLRKLKEGQYQAIMLALAGIRRLGLENEVAEILSTEQMCPAAGQGALAIQTRVDDPAEKICAGMDHAPTRDAVSCERAVLSALGGGCQLPVGVFAICSDSLIHVHAVVAKPDGSRYCRSAASSDKRDPSALARIVAEDLLKQGAGRLLADIA